MSKYRNSKLDQFAAAFKALANPHRLRIFLRLVACGPAGRKCEIDSECACIGEVSEDLGLAASTVSHHIKELSRSGLIETRRQGQKVECWVPVEIVTELSGFFQGCCTGESGEPWQLIDKSAKR